MSFQRRSVASSLKGVRPGLVATTSAGSSQLDSILGGGLPLGSVNLIAEDAHNVFAIQLTKSFIAEGIAHGHRVMIIDGGTSLDLSELPKKIPREWKLPQTRDEMKIAFRYERLPEHQSLPESQSDHIFDFVLSIEPEELAKADIVRCNCLVQSSEEILRILASSIPSDNVLRVVATVGLLLDHKFLRTLKILSRHVNVVCWVSVPHCCSNERFQRFFAIADAVLSLVAFSSDQRKTNPLYKKHHGLLNLDKIPEINSITGHKPPCVEYAFHQTGKRFDIEQLHMPPDLSESPPTMSCQTSGGNRAMDF
ncbi:putative elongator complex protein 4 [Galendromus occidentalis]|uniref:Elongator complex protein 4 n=1 Tax=Galendromus occidentalis TaxID=34638 RepID=A0AAJ7WI69_9ACAR|nr:putative elongator complex protein 4 [Galendromus occidentalis]